MTPASSSMYQRIVPVIRPPCGCPSMPLILRLVGVISPMKSFVSFDRLAVAQLSIRTIRESVSKTAASFEEPVSSLADIANISLDGSEWRVPHLLVVLQRTLCLVRYCLVLIPVTYVSSAPTPLANSLAMYPLTCSQGPHATQRLDFGT